MKWRNRKTGTVIEKNGTNEAPPACLEEQIDCEECPAAKYSQEKYGGLYCEKLGKKDFLKFMEIMGWELQGECHVCKVGTLVTGIGHVELTMDQYREELKREPVMTPKKFRRFSFCPDCGRKIDWRENDETD